MYSDLDKDDVKEEGLNIMSPDEFEKKVKKNSIMFALVVEKVSKNSLNGITWGVKYIVRKVFRYMLF